MEAIFAKRDGRGKRSPERRQRCDRRSGLQREEVATRGALDLDTPRIAADQNRALRPFSFSSSGFVVSSAPPCSARHPPSGLFFCCGPAPHPRRYGDGRVAEGREPEEGGQRSGKDEGITRGPKDHCRKWR